MISSDFLFVFPCESVIAISMLVCRCCRITSLGFIRIPRTHLLHIWCGTLSLCFVFSCYRYCLLIWFICGRPHWFWDPPFGGFSLVHPSKSCIMFRSQIWFIFSVAISPGDVWFIRQSLRVWKSVFWRWSLSWRRCFFSFAWKEIHSHKPIYFGAFQDRGSVRVYSSSWFVAHSFKTLLLSLLKHFLLLSLSALNRLELSSWSYSNGYVFSWRRVCLSSYFFFILSWFFLFRF